MLCKFTVYNGQRSSRVSWKLEKEKEKELGKWGPW